MNILEEIIAVKQKEVAAAKQRTSVSELELMPNYGRQTNSLVAALHASPTGIVAEFKRASPSKGVINSAATVEDVVDAYAFNGAAGISVLTDQQFFHGSLDDLLKARKATLDTPILRKEFIIDKYQILEAKAFGADVILLIAACLSPQRVNELARFAKDLQLEVLLEIHNEEEIQHICEAVDIVGVNNRDLKTFIVDIERSVELASHIPANKTKISESGISSVQNIQYLKSHGFTGFLIGENFMKEENPAIAFVSFVDELTSAQTMQR